MDKAAIRKALDEATPGNWIVQPGDYYDAVYSSQSTMLTVVASRTIAVDAHLIANAPTWLRELLEENDRLQAERDAYREALEWYAAHRTLVGKRARQALRKEQTP